jgi:mycoredoxin
VLLRVERGQDLRQRGSTHCGILALVTDTQRAAVPFTMYSTSTCGPCFRLKLRLNELEVRFVEVNIEDDADAAAWVMSVNDGDRLVPTLLFADGSWLTNPSAEDVLAHLADIEA